MKQSIFKWDLRIFHIDNTLKFEKTKLQKRGKDPKKGNTPRERVIILKIKIYKQYRKKEF